MTSERHDLGKAIFKVRPCLDILAEYEKV